MADRKALVLCCVLLVVHTKYIQGACPKGCTCDDLDSGLAVNCNGLKTLPNEFPEMTTKITICGLQTKEIPSRAFCLLPKLQTIEILLSRVEIIQKFAFSGLKDLEKIGIYFSHVSSIEGLAFSNLLNVSHIEFHNTTIKQIRGGGFSNISSVRDISFNNVTINEIHPMAFTRVRKIAMFSIRNSHLEMIETGAFHLPSFAFFFVHSNTFGKIMCGTFDVAIKHAMNQVSFGGNTICCSCDMLWMFQNERKKILLKFLKGLTCTNPNAQEMNRTLASYSWADLPCHDSQAREAQPQDSIYCPSFVQVEQARTGALSNGNTVLSTTKPYFFLYAVSFYFTFLMRKSFFNL